MSDVVVVKALRKSYGEFEAVRGIDLTVGEGEVVAILGPNGAGKTTTVEILEGYRKRSAGEVSVLGQDPATAGPKWRARLGIVLQECGFDDYLTASELLHMHADYYPKARRVDDVLAMVGLEEKAGARVKTLSGGQRRRLDVGLGLIGDPDLLFLDEPTTGFDPSARRQSWELVKALRLLGRTIVLTTHYMDEAQALADRLVIVAKGVVVATGSPEEIGGRATALSRIDFVLGQGVAPPSGAQRFGGGWRIVTNDVVADVHQLTGWSLDGGGRIESLTVTRPTLEDTYLELVKEDEPSEVPATLSTMQVPSV